MKKILITGAGGLLGCSLVPLLQTFPFDIVTVTLNSRLDNNHNIDLTDFKNVNAFLNNIKPDVIINLAALTNIDKCEKNPNLAYLTNVKIVENFVNSIKYNNLKTHFIQFSTDHLYSTSGFNNEKNIKIINYYSLSKYSAEIAASQINSTIIRTNFFGLSRSKNKSSFSDKAIHSLKNNIEIKLFDDVYFTPLSINKLCELVKHIIINPKYGTFNIGSKEGMTKLDFVLKFAKILQLSVNSIKPISSVNLKLEAKRALDMRMDVNYFETVYGMKLPSLDDEILSVAKDYENEF